MFTCSLPLLLCLFLFVFYAVSVNSQQLIAHYLPGDKDSVEAFSILLCNLLVTFLPKLTIGRAAKKVRFEVFPKLNFSLKCLAYLAC